MVLLQLVLCALVSGSGFLRAQAEPPKAAIVSPKHPVDSRGETVYEIRGGSQEAEPVIPGVLVMPHPTKMVRPEMTEALKRMRYSGQIAIDGVITATGEAIDLEGPPGENADVVASALEAVKRYRFAAATLDGKPVAVRLRVLINFKIF